MEELIDWKTYEDLISNLSRAMEERKSEITFARLIPEEDLNCMPDHLLTEKSGKGVLEHLQGRAHKIVSRLLTANFILIIINLEGAVTLGVRLHSPPS